MDELNSYKRNKNYGAILPNINYNNIPKKEIIPNYLNETNNSKKKENYEMNNHITEENKNEKMNNYNKKYPEFHTYDNESYSLKKNNSQMNLFNENYCLNYEEEQFSSFLGNIKISNFYSSAEIIVLIEKILRELNFEKNYTFNIKDSLITFSFGDVNKALAIFKRLNIIKLNNVYYRNLVININLDFKNEKNKINRNKIVNQLEEELNDEKEKILFKKKLTNRNKLKEITNITNINQSQNFKPNKISKSTAIDQSFENIYKRYQGFYRKRKEERRKRELSYVKGKNASLQSCTPYVENDNRNYFVESLRKYKGNFIAPSDFCRYIDKASRELI